MKKVCLPDGSALEIDAQASILDIAKQISRGLGKAAVAGVINDQPVDLCAVPADGDIIRILTFNDDEGKQVFWHTASHVLAQAVQRLQKKAKLAIGPAIAEGYYYDIDTEKSFSLDDLAKIEKEMQKIVKENLPITRTELPKEEAIALFKEKDATYKLEMIEDLEDGTISMYQQGDFSDLCRGPHLPSTGYVKYFKLMKIAGAYWRGDDQRDMLQRIYGVAFPKKKMLEEHLYYLEEAKKRDHKKLGKELELFTFFPEGPGFPFWYDKGNTLYNLVLEYCREMLRENRYQEIQTPMILNESLWHRSGHYGFYKDNMYFTEIDGEPYAVKPMNCPGNLILFKSKKHSYRELPIKMAEFGVVHRHEKSGVLNGLFRVRKFTQDDAHVFCSPEQLEQEIITLIDTIHKVYHDFGFTDYKVELSTRPEKAIGSDEIWEKSEKALQLALEKKNIDYKVNEGDGAFYGPKIDFHITDCLKREWQCGTIQVDFSMPERFELEYVGSDGNVHRPVMIHRAILGSVERFIGNLIEHYAGNFPVWLAPVQVKILNISEDTREYADQIYQKLFDQRIRVEMDDRSDTIGNKIRKAENEKIPYMLIIGEKEKDQNVVAIRKHRKGNVGQKSFEDFLAMIQDEIQNRTYELD